MLLEIQNIDVYYGKFQALKDVSLQLEDEEIAILIGQNGTGKTTTMKSVMGALKPRSGTITYKEEDITGLDPHEVSRKGIAFVPGERRIFKGLSVEENLRVGSMAHDNDETFEESLERVFTYFPQLREKRNAEASKMSGGQQQMLAIGRALVSDPDLLLLDEPVEGLMPTAVNELRQNIEKLREDGMTMIVVEHNLEFAYAISDKAFIILDGEIVYSCPTAELEANKDIQEKYLSV